MRSTSQFITEWGSEKWGNMTRENNFHFSPVIMRSFATSGSDAWN